MKVIICDPCNVWEFCRVISEESILNENGKETVPEDCCPLIKLLRLTGDYKETK